MESSRGRGEEPRVLYWFRTPPGVKVGREPFDEATRRALEANYPQLTFDWRKLGNIPTPPPDPRMWRERRKAEREAKKARAAEEAADAAPDEVAAEQGATEGIEEGVAAEDVQQAGGEEPQDDIELPAAGEIDHRAGPVETPQAAEGAGSGGNAAPGGPSGRRRRRRRGGRRRRRGAPAGPQHVVESAAETGEHEVPSGSSGPKE
jgi:ribonuclease E